MTIVLIRVKESGSGDGGAIQEGFGLRLQPAAPVLIIKRADSTYRRLMRLGNGGRNTATTGAKRFARQG